MPEALLDVTSLAGGYGAIDVLFDVDWQGAAALRAIGGELRLLERASHKVPGALYQPPFRPRQNCPMSLCEQRCLDN